MPENDDDSPFEYLGNGLYRIPKDRIDEVTFIHPGAIDHDSPDIIRVTPEPITANTELSLADIVLYYDKNSRNPLDGGFNQWAFVVDSRKALFLRGRVRSISIKKLKRTKGAVFIRRVPQGIAPAVAAMLLKYRWRPAFFSFAEQQLQMNNYAPFLWGSFFPPDPTYASDEEYEETWNDFVSTLEPHDCLLTFDRRSKLSKFIAVFTHGPFSHLAHYIGDGQIWESVTSGTRIAPLETYKGRHYRVAAYRNYGIQFVSKEQAMAYYKRSDGKSGYNYIGAARAGIRTFFGDRHYSPATPNGIILSGRLTFIAQV